MEKTFNKQNILLLALIFVFPLFAQENSSGKRKEIFYKYLTFNQLTKNATLHPVWSDIDDSFRFTENGVLYKVDPVKNTKEADASKQSSPSAPGQMANSSPGGKYFIEENNNNIVLGTTAGEEKTPITTDGTQDYSWYISGSVWSPDETKVILQRSDSRKVHQIPLVDYTKALETVEWARYAKAGDELSRTELYIYDINSKSIEKIDTGAENYYIFGLEWLPDGAGYLFLKMSRNCKVMELLSYNPVSGEIKTLITEKQNTFVAGLDFVSFGWQKQLTILKNSKNLIWLSERDGWKHLYLYDFQGNLIRQLTKGDFCTDEVSAVDEKSKLVYFAAYGGTGINDRHLYRVDFKGKSLKRLTATPGFHVVYFSPSKQYYIDTHSGINRPPVHELHKSDGTLLQAFLRADITALQDINWKEPESFVVKADDGVTDIYGVLYKPFDFNPANKYPVIDFIYQGLFFTSAPSSFSIYSRSALFAQAMSQMGFIAVVIDGRALPNRSKAFQDASFGNIGKIEIPDQVAAIKQAAATRPYMDLSRVGIYGHSWGGYFSLRGMLMAPDFFKVGVASAPGELTEAPEINEPYMDLPEINKEGYEFGLNSTHADKLKGKLLLIHGTHDVNAPVSTTLRMVDKLIKAGKLHDLAIIPKMDHYFQNPVFQNYYWELVIGYFIEHLKPYSI